MQVQASVEDNLAQTDTVETLDAGTACEQIQTRETEIQTQSLATVDASTDYIWPVCQESTQTDMKSLKDCET